MYDCLGACHSSLECCIADAIAGTWKHAKQTYTQPWDGTSDAKASVIFQVHKTLSKSHGLQAGSAFMKKVTKHEMKVPLVASESCKQFGSHIEQRWIGEH